MTDLSNHPIVLHSDLFAEHEHAPQTQFVAERQVAFLEALAVTGSVRAAARRVKVSHQTCYRARRNSAAFGRAWDAALVVARAAAEAKLADCAMNGVEEEVWYHGELVGTRRRLSDRLLLAHLGRLDRLRTDTRIEDLAENFDAMLSRMRRGGAIEVEEACVPAQAGTSLGSAQRHEAPACAGDREISIPGPCNMRSMSGAGEGLAEAPDASPEPPCDCIGARLGTDRGQPHYRVGPEGWEPVCNVGETADGAAALCCAAPSWPECRECPHYPRVSRLIEEMDEARPADAPPVEALPGPAWEVEACQMAAFEAGDEDWWRYGADWALHTRNAAGEWVVEGEGVESPG